MNYSDQTQQIRSLQRRRMLWLVLAHVPALLLWLLGFGWWALLPLALLHALLLWGTLYPQSGVFGPVLCNLPARDARVWLTIDDGPSADTAAILDLLARHNARATFFLVAERAARQPALVQRIVAAGHDIGNHSATHPQAWFWCLSPAHMTREIVGAQRTLSELQGRPVRWFRAVVGHANPFVQPVLRVLGLQRVAWSARAFDAVDGDVDRVVTRLLRKLRPGAVMLLHEGAAHGHNVQIIDRLLQELAQRGYRSTLPQ